MPAVIVTIVQAVDAVCLEVVGCCALCTFWINFQVDLVFFVFF